MNTFNIKSLIISIVFTIINLVVLGQREFKVLMVKPSTVFINEKTLQIGDTFHESDLLVFSNKNDLLKVCFNNCSQTKILTGGIFKASKATSLKEYLIETNGLSTRGELDNDCITFENLKKQSKIGIIGELKICLDTNIYSHNGKNYFIFKYEIDEQLGDCKLLSWEDNLIIDENILDTIYYKTNANKFNLTLKYHSHQENLNYTLIKNLYVSYINPVIITSELHSILVNPEVEMIDKQEIVRSYLTIFFPYVEILQIPIDKILSKI